MEILARAVGRRKEAVAQIQLVRGNGQFLINDKPAQAYLQNNSCSLICIKSPLQAALSLFPKTPLVPSSTEGTFGTFGTFGTPLTNEVTVGLEVSDNKKEINKDVETGNLTQGNSEFKLEGVSDLGQGENSLLLSKEAQQNGDMNNRVEGVFNWGEKEGEIDIIVKVKGGGLIGQAEAIKLGVARAFCIMENSYGGALLRKILKTKGYLTQDSRVKERRKYGLKKARKASQYHKR